MKNKLFFGVLVIFVTIIAFFWRKLPGINDTPMTPVSSFEAKNKGLLLSNYLPNKKRIIIGDEKYLIKDSWSCYCFKNKYSNEINKNMYFFFLVVQNEKTGEINKSQDVAINLKDYMVYEGQKCGYSNGVGVIGQNFALDFITESCPSLPLTIKVGFRNRNGIDFVEFIKDDGLKIR